jgi:hypothetical protein
MLSKTKTHAFVVLCALAAAFNAAGKDALLIKAKWSEVSLPVKLVPSNAPRIPKVDGLMKRARRSVEDLIKKSGLKLSLVTYPNGGEPKMPTNAYVCFDDANLYLMMVASQSKKYKLRANKQEKESAHIWYDDNFELFVDPFLSRSEYAHFIVNPLGELYDAWCLIKMIPDPKGVDQSELIPQLVTDMKYSSGAKVATRIGTGEWMAVFTVPFASLGLPSAPLGQPWGFNFCHSNRENKELSEWKLTKGGLGFHTPSKYGALIFGNTKPPVAAKFAMNIAGYGKNILTLETDSPKAVDAVVSVSVAGGKTAAVKIKIPKGKARKRFLSRFPGRFPANAK